jgi:hypothetical protein
MLPAFLRTLLNTQRGKGLMVNLVERAPGAGRPGSLERQSKKTKNRCELR